MIDQIKTWIEKNTSWKLKAVGACNYDLEYIPDSYWTWRQLDDLFLHFPILKVTIQTKRTISNKILTTLTISKD